MHGHDPQCDDESGYLHFQFPPLHRYDEIDDAHVNDCVHPQHLSFHYDDESGHEAHLFPLFLRRYHDSECRPLCSCDHENDYHVHGHRHCDRGHGRD